MIIYYTVTNRRFKVMLLYLPFLTCRDNRFQTFMCHYLNWAIEYNGTEPVTILYLDNL